VLPACDLFFCVCVLIHDPDVRRLHQGPGLAPRGLPAEKGFSGRAFAARPTRWIFAN
jgi:hypothetical protein